jgi:hypothetical protein
MPLHPGVGVALARFNMDETQLARAIAAGELTSPQVFANSTYFALRITGTGTAFRSALDEYVYRRPEHYLNDEFLARCNGLPVIAMHPDRSVLDSRSFAEQVIGTIVLPYIGREGVIAADGDEVWGIARIMDGAAARLMQSEQLSTSPAVAMLDRDTTTKIDLSDGRHLLIEGKPALLDHLAVCYLGVWDKGKTPVGVEAGIADSQIGGNAGVERAGLNTGNLKEKAMADEKETKTEDRADEKLDKFLEKLDSKLDGLHTRMDSIEERQREDKARRDAAEEEDEKARKDAEEAEEEFRQAEELEKLAAEERAEGEEARGDAAGKPSFLCRNDGESVTEHSNRVHGFAAKSDAAGFCRKDGESHAEHSARCDALGKKMARKDSEEGEEDGKPPGTPKEAEKVDSKKDDDGGSGEAKEETEEMKKEAEEESARKDAELKQIKADSEKIANELADLKRKVEVRPDDEEAAFADVQARADDVFSALGERAPRALPGETLAGYRVRLARKLQPHSATLKEIDLAAISRADAKGFTALEDRVYADAATAARNPTDVPVGALREIRKRRPGGGEIIEFAGQPISWMASFMQPAQYLKGVDTNRRS